MRFIDNHKLFLIYYISTVLAVLSSYNKSFISFKKLIQTSDMSAYYRAEEVIT
jgi:hypothetical protein